MDVARYAVGIDRMSAIQNQVELSVYSFSMSIREGHVVEMLKKKKSSGSIVGYP